MTHPKERLDGVVPGNPGTAGDGTLSYGESLRKRSTEAGYQIRQNKHQAQFDTRYPQMESQVTAAIPSFLGYMLALHLYTEQNTRLGRNQNFSPLVIFAKGYQHIVDLLPTDRRSAEISQKATDLAAISELNPSTSNEVQALVDSLQDHWDQLSLESTKPSEKKSRVRRTAAKMSRNIFVQLSDRDQLRTLGYLDGVLSFANITQLNRSIEGKNSGIDLQHENR